MQKDGNEMSLRAACLAVVGGILVLTAVACSSSDEGGSSPDATPNPNGALDGASCKVGFDCKSGICTDGKCAPGAGGGGDPKNGVKDGNETDVDCGGTGAPPCADGKSCIAPSDCQSAVCKAGKCAAPGPTDGVKNADETDVDCGGKVAPKCAVGKGCAAHGDCESDACSYQKKCVEYKGCTGHFGGDTCGAGETGTADAKHESCCTTVAVTDAPNGGFVMDKYQVTAGRMRAFIERYNGDLKSWAATNPKGWNPAWTSNLPGNMADALYALGPGGKRGCDVVNQGGRTYWQDPIAGNPNERSDFSKDVLDEKALNCVPWYLAQAVCVFDGARLAKSSEIAWTFENRGRQGGATQYPWQFKDTSAYNPNAQDPRLVHYYSYATPNPPANMRLVNNDYALDHAFFIAPPGRRPTGANMHGIQDLAGNMLMWVNDNPKQFSYTLSWEKHPKNLTPTTWNAQDGPDGYYAIGARCARDP
jgi:formylglycine-generating enzyme required for sulfatase activity